MSTGEVVLNGHTRGSNWDHWPWLHSKGWDLSFITLSSVLVVIPLALYEFVGNSATFVNLFIAGIIGGPHMYATFFRTTLDRPFRQRHRVLMKTSLLIPLLVVLLALWNFQLLITMFFFLGLNPCLASDRIYPGVLRSQTTPHATAVVAGD